MLAHAAFGVGAVGATCCGERKASPAMAAAQGEWERSGYALMYLCVLLMCRREDGVALGALKPQELSSAPPTDPSASPTHHSHSH